MKLISTTQIPDSILPHLDLDVFVTASGYETRAVHVVSFLDMTRIRVKTAFGFTDRITPQREENDRTLQRAGVKLIAAGGDSAEVVRETVRRHVEEQKQECVRVFVDYSCMTRSWYAGVIEAISSVQNKERVECLFSYGPAQFTQPLDTSPNAVVGPIPGFCSLDVPEKPSALVIGLGYERERALGLHDYIDPAVSFAFYTDPALDQQYRDVVLANNSVLLKRLPKERVYRHPLADLQRTGNSLLSLYSGLRDDYRVILAPLGVKPFSLLCLLLATRFGDIDVWRVSPGTKAPPQDRKALGPLLLLQAVFGKQSLEALRACP